MGEEIRTEIVGTAPCLTVNGVSYYLHNDDPNFVFQQDMKIVFSDYSCLKGKGVFLECNVTSVFRDYHLMVKVVTLNCNPFILLLLKIYY